MVKKDFYGLAAFFGRVGHKGTGLSPPISGGEEMVLVKNSGEVRHPITQEVLSPTPLLMPSVSVPVEQDPREVLVDWMTSSDNPYFAQVAVNRIWADLFGIGLVDPVDDLRATNPPSNPELLKALANYYLRGWLRPKEAAEVHYDLTRLLARVATQRIELCGQSEFFTSLSAAHAS